MRKGQHVNVYGFKMKVKGISGNKVFVERSGKLHEVSKKQCEKINRYTIR